jgi:hypothetical protein
MTIPHPLQALIDNLRAQGWRAKAEARQSQRTSRLAGEAFGRWQGLVSAADQVEAYLREEER